MSRHTRLHRTTVQRLLETLHREGYLSRGESKGSYRLALQVRELSAGFTYPDWISATAAPVMLELLDKVVWPSSLCTLSGDSMIIRQTTHGMSQASFHQDMVGQHAPVLLTAAGRACFAFLPVRRRQEVLRSLRAGRDAQAKLARDKRFIRDLVEKVHRDGYASNTGDWQEEPKTGAVALPILYRGSAVAALNIVYPRTAVPQGEAIRKYVPVLREAVTRISALLQDGLPGSISSVERMST